MSSEKTISICLWSSPRNISTALMYAFGEREDMSIVDEPLYAYYLNHTGVDHPGKSMILKSQSIDGQEVISDIILGDYPTSYSLHKQMTHHLDGLDLTFLKQTKNVLLIRSPYEIVLSYSKVRQHVTPEDIGIPQQYELFKTLKAMNGLTAIVDSKLLLQHPENILNKLCDALEIPFLDNMLSWKSGPRKEDGVWAEYWYSSVHKSTGFQQYRPKDEPLTPALQQVVEECQPYYDTLLNHALK